MDLIMLMIIAVVIKSVFDSQKAKDKSKSRDAQRQDGPERHEAPPGGRPKPQTAKQPTKPVGLEDIFGQMMGKMKESMSLETEPAKPQKASSGQPKKKKAAEASKGKKKQQTPKQQTEASAHRPREERLERERLKPTVTPVKSVFDENDSCGHRMELNPNIEHNKGQEQPKQKRAAIAVKHDQETILQSIIWAEILSKPKAVENRERYAQR